MTTIPLGLGAYKRAYGAFPEVQLLNRFVEKAPTNLKEKVALLTRPATKLLNHFPAGTETGRIRGTYSSPGVFNSDLFVVSGQNLYRYDGTTVTQIGGQILGSGTPRVGFVKGIGYEYLFIADSLLLNYYSGGSKASGVMTDTGGTAATGVLTNSGAAVFTGAKIAINGVYYGWNNAVNTGTPAGTSANPWLVPIGAGGATALANMVKAINFVGTPGVDFSTALPGANADVSAVSGASTLTLTARVLGTAGNTITTTTSGDAALSWGGATLSGGNVTVITNVKVLVGTVYYGWNAAVNTGPPDGTLAHPFLCLPGVNDAAALANMANMINFVGTSGTDFSSTLTAANTQVTASNTSSTLTLTARVDSTAGNAIATVASGDSHVSFASATLTGGGTHALHGVPVPSGEGVSLVAVLDLFTFVGVNNSQKFYYIRPGATTIATLDFVSKESAPDPLSDLVAVGDTLLVIGTASTEFWAATGDNSNPFAPITGRTMSRGAVPGTAVMLDERTVMLVGNDGRVYSVTGTPEPVSDHGIEERIRKQLRREAGLT